MNKSTDVKILPFDFYLQQYSSKIRSDIEISISELDKQDRINPYIYRKKTKRKKRVRKVNLDDWCVI